MKPEAPKKIQPKQNIKAVKYMENDLNKIIPTILNCLSHVSETKFYGLTTLIDILRGAKSKKILDAQLDKIPEYSALNNISREDLISIIEWLIENHFILQTKGAYPVLHPTYDGIHYKETMTQAKLEKLSKFLHKK